LKRQKKKGGKLPVDLVKLVEIAISPVLRKSLAQFEVAFTNPVAHLLLDWNCRISANPSVEIACLPMVTCGTSGRFRPIPDVRGTAAQSRPDCGGIEMDCGDR